ncbi:hypothetical protein EOL73_02240 [Candidatus Saccharibacteria bacterium]|nr:hypothetical protein [Candidatus Saccharibacteria bacterium]NCU40557.1 hypothetical protein [Candidatus Saccharibacteria bacterium]
MFQLDDKFLQDIGLADLPEDQKQAFLQHIYSELELRVGTKLSEGLSEDQMAEFETFIDRDEEAIRKWFAQYMPGYADLPDYQRLKTAAPAEVGEIDVMAEYGSLKWLEFHRPDYRDVVAAELESMKKEILANKDTILDVK